MKMRSNPGLRITYVNLKKANWDRYRQEVDAVLSNHSLPTDCQRDEKIFRTVLLKVASHHIPTGRHRLHEEPVPADILYVKNRRDDLQKRYPTCCCLPIPMTLASGGSPMFPLVVHQPASPSIWPAVQSLRRGLSTNPGVTMWYVCGCS